MAYLFGAYLVLWAITFGYVFSIGARQKRLQQELQRLREQAETEDQPTP
jgi:CcmD family protein